jgi:hypothetical protein
MSSFRCNFLSCNAENVIAGGNVVLLYASKYQDIHTVVNVSGRYDLSKGIEERLGKKTLCKESRRLEFLKSRIKKGNLLVYVQHGHVCLRI